MFAAIVCWDGAGLPDVNVDDGERRGDGPRVDKFAVATDAGVGEDAVGTGFEPCLDVGAEFVPMESEPDSV